MWKSELEGYQAEIFSKRSLRKSRDKEEMGEGREIYADKWVMLAAARCPNHDGHGCWPCSPGRPALKLNSMQLAWHARDRVDSRAIWKALTNTLACNKNCSSRSPLYRS